VKGREHIIRVHMKKIKAGKDVKPEWLARGTPGFSGAELANLVNEAALLAARFNLKKVSMDDFERAKDKILMGTERRTLAMTDDEKKLTAYHEAGHAIVGRLVPDHDPVYKVTIIPRGRALGVTMYLPERDRVSYSKQRLESQLSSLFGGRVAEELIFGKDSVTTGASNDIERATSIAKSMVTKWGLSEKLGPLKYSDETEHPFLGQSMGRSHAQTVSESTAEIIDQEVRAIIDRNYQRSEKILRDNIDILHAMSESLMLYETIDTSQVDSLMERQAVKPLPGWDSTLSARGPVEDDKK
jgi:cell division protease FtsH